MDNIVLQGDFGGSIYSVLWNDVTQRFAFRLLDHNAGLHHAYT